MSPGSECDGTTPEYRTTVKDLIMSKIHGASKCSALRSGSLLSAHAYCLLSLSNQTQSRTHTSCVIYG